MIRALLLASVFIAVWYSVTDARAAKRREPVQVTICRVFGVHCYEALTVAWCESRWKPWARNGQYHGLLQLGADERRRYARGRYDTIYYQAVAAHRYFVATGRDWGAWECKP